MTITAEDYAEGVINMTETISERFIIEHVSYVEPSLYVWIYNYGDVDIEVKVQVGDVTYPENSEDWIEVESKDMVPVPPTALTETPTPGDELNIKAYSRRGNNAYYRYLVP